MSTRVSVDRQSRSITTSGLAAKGQPDFRLAVDSDELLVYAEEFSHRLINYVLRSEKRILSGQTVTHGYWTVQFLAGTDGLLEAWEFTSESQCQQVRPGIEFTLKCWQGQHDLCTAVGAAFGPPHASHTVYVSEGVYEGVLPLEGVRYPAHPPDAGWFLTTDQYNGDFRSLKRVHLFHLTEARPELIPLVGLPAGYRFTLKDEDCDCDVWFDPEAAKRPRA